MKDGFNFARMNEVLCVCDFPITTPPPHPGVKGEVENGKMGDCCEFHITLIRPSLASSDM